MKAKDIEKSFKHHDLSDIKIESVCVLRKLTTDLAHIMNHHCGVDSAEKTLAIRKLEEALMWANKAIALHGRKNKRSKK